jgi:putative DNA primase/helicase
MTTLRSAADILRDYRITAPSTPGRYYALCPQCSHKRKPANQKLKCLGVTIDNKGLKIGCNHCGWTGGEFYRGSSDRRARIRTPAIPIQTPRTSPEPSELARIAQAVRLWNGGVDPRGTLAEQYLTSRKLELTDDIAGRVVRFHATCPWGRDECGVVLRPVMLTPFRSIVTDDLVAVHRTLLPHAGPKPERMMLGPAGGAAIKIDDDTDVEQGLHIGEGFETCLAGRQLGFRPVWALGSASAIGKFPVLAGIDALTVFGETDDDGANLANAKACARRWSDAGREAWLLRPNIVGDMNNVVMKS